MQYSALCAFWNIASAFIPLETEFFQIISKNSIWTSQETLYISPTTLNLLMMFGETVVVYCEDHTEHTDTLCG
jgi:hypothetical protein